MKTPLLLLTLLTTYALHAQEVKLSATTLNSVAVSVEHRSISYAVHRVFAGPYNAAFTALEVSPRWYFGANAGAGPVVQYHFSRAEGETLQGVAVGGMLTIRTANFERRPMLEFGFGLQSSGRFYDEAVPVVIRGEFAVGIGKRRVVSCR